MNRQETIAVCRPLITRCVLGFCLLFILFRGAGHLWPSQLLQPPLARVHFDYTEWLFQLSGLAAWLVQNETVAKAFMALLLIIGSFSFIFPVQRQFTISFSILYFIFTLCFTLYLTHNAAYTCGFVWVLFTFWPRRNEDFARLWEGFRYYACWIYASTFLLKLWHGAFWQWDGGVLSAKANLADYIFHHPDTFPSHIYYWFFQHPNWLNLGHKVTMLAEGLFLVGFFTKKLDRALIFAALFIFTSTWLFADVFFAELMVICFAFFPARWWQRLWLLSTPKAIHNPFTTGG